LTCPEIPAFTYNWRGEEKGYDFVEQVYRESEKMGAGASNRVGRAAKENFL
jgi:hypothetical protein